MHETDETIGQWADQTFGQGTVRTRSLRLLSEVLELCFAAGATEEEAIDCCDAAMESLWETETTPDPGEIPGELADCRIILATIAHTAGVGLGHETDRKMAINRARKWRMTTQGCGQHED